MRYLYDSNFYNEIVLKCKRLAEQKGIQTIDTISWDEDEKMNYYMGVFLPISVKYHRKMKGRIRTHKAGLIHFNGVLLTDDNFYVRDEALEKLREC